MEEERRFVVDLSAIVRRDVLERAMLDSVMESVEVCLGSGNAESLPIILSPLISLYMAIRETDMRQRRDREEAEKSEEGGAL